ncbi:hypothetical protein ES703_78597 [subsurface metagenome]
MGIRSIYSQLFGTAVISASGHLPRAGLDAPLRSATRGVAQLRSKNKRTSSEEHALIPCWLGAPKHPPGGLREGGQGDRLLNSSKRIRTLARQLDNPPLLQRRGGGLFSHLQSPASRESGYSGCSRFLKGYRKVIEKLLKKSQLRPLISQAQKPSYQKPLVLV